jgi:hypothetical protein
MAYDLVQIREQAKEKEDENYRFRRFLKTKCNLEPEEIDERVFATTIACGPESTAPNAPTAARRCILPSAKRRSTGWPAASQ